jgi:type 1 fimbriae regulatory protein FimB
MKTNTALKPKQTALRSASPSREMSRVEKGKPQLVVVAVDAHERERDFLAKWEVDALVKAAREGRHGVRDALIVSLMFRHGLRATELCRLRVSDFNLQQARVWVKRMKNGLSTEHPLDGDDLRLVRRYLRERPTELPWLFVSERGAALTRKGVYYLVTTAAKRAGDGVAIHVHPHMLRHSTGHELANQGRDLRLIQDYLGQRDPKNSVRYTQTAAARFEGIFGR